MRARTRLSLVASLVVITTVGVMWGSFHRAETPLGVVIITLDTTRRIGCRLYGFMNVSLPSLERLAREGVVFDQATSVAPLTLPAHTSLFTGLLPPNHGVRDNADTPLAENDTTLAEILLARRVPHRRLRGVDRAGSRSRPEAGIRAVPRRRRSRSRGPEARQRRADEVMTTPFAGSTPRRIPLLPVDASVRCPSAVRSAGTVPHDLRPQPVRRRDRVCRFADRPAAGGARTTAAAGSHRRDRRRRSRRVARRTRRARPRHLHLRGRASRAADRARAGAAADARRRRRQTHGHHAHGARPAATCRRRRWMA